MVIGGIQIHSTWHRMEQPELDMLWLGGWLRVLQMTFQMKVFKGTVIIQNIENPSLKKKRQEWQVGPQDVLKVSWNKNLPLQHINSPGWWGTEQPALMSKLAMGRGARPMGSFPKLIPDTALYLSLYCDSRMTLLKQALVSLCKAIVVWNPSTVNYPQKVTFLTKPTLRIFKSTREPARRTRKREYDPPVLASCEHKLLH